MKAECRILVTLKWKEQSVADALHWARATVRDESRLKDFEAGVRAGWDECIKTLKMHNLLTLTD